MISFASFIARSHFLISFLLSFFVLNQLLAKNPNQFVDVTFEAGIDFRHHDGRSGQKYLLETLGSGASFFDYDNDGDTDLYIVNGADLPGCVSPVSPTNILYRNNGNGTFTDMTKIAGVGNMQYGVGCAAADYDNDGDVDLLVFNCNQSVTLLRNDGGNANNWLAVKLVGVQSNRDGIGARIRVTVEGEVRMAEVQSAASYLSANDLRVIFGLGRKKVVDEIEVLWPGGNKQTLTSIKANQLIEITEKI